MSFKENLIMTKYDVIIIGAGPAGIAAAIFAARGTLSVLVIDESAPAGGTVKNTHLVANYPGFPEPVSGLDLSNLKIPSINLKWK